MFVPGQSFCGARDALPAVDDFPVKVFFVHSL